LPLSLHRDYFFARRLFSYFVRASLVCHFCSPTPKEISHRPTTHDLPATSLFRGLVVSFLNLRTLAVPSIPLTRKRLWRDDIIAATSSDSDRGDATYETDLTELEDVPSPRKRLRPDENLALEPEVSYNAVELYEDLLDEGGVDLSEIPEDFDKVPGTIERRERIE
ncbi:hypothetical protein N7508_002745, partial [Penicillium antarcticum]|uniref:uncharacterized protein n=1 Tax=Penicillium antarcticum TaxID=416450 RepID=UPI0023968EBA